MSIEGYVLSNCGDNAAVFTGTGGCSMFEGTPNGILIFEARDKLDPDAAGTDGDLYNQITNRIKGNLNLPFVTPLYAGLVNLEVTGGDMRTNQEGFGNPSPNGLNPKTDVLTFLEGGLCLFKQLTKLNNRKVRVMLVDESNDVYCTAFRDGTDRKVYLRGFDATLYVTRRANNGTAPGAILLSIIYSNVYQEEEKNISKFSVPSEFQGVRPIAWQRIGAPGDITAGTIKGNIILPCSGENVGSEIADLVGVLPSDAFLFRSVVDGSLVEASGSTILNPDFTITVEKPANCYPDVMLKDMRYLTGISGQDIIDAYLNSDGQFHDVY